jgi:hypothetical protein
MRRLIVEHCAAVVVVGLLLLALTAVLESADAGKRETRRRPVAPYLSLPHVDLGDPLHEVLFRETLTIFYPGQSARNDSLLAAVQEYRRSVFTDPREKSGGGPRGLPPPVLWRLLEMYLQFVVVFGVAMALSYAGARSLGVYRFFRQRQEALGERPRRPAWQRVGIAILRALAYALFFSPAYVVAYALRTRVNTDSQLVLILLAVCTNGLLVTAANRFFTALTAEHRKGYVQTAVVKGLRRSYAFRGRGGVALRAVFFPARLASSHVFHAMYENARLQFVPALKEQASFLITGLIIIEMALNIQGHLGYELLQALLAREVAEAALIVFGLFTLVKAAELAVDVWHQTLVHRYENRDGAAA